MKNEPGGATAWPWADSLDALAAAAKHHRRLFENDRVRVLEVRIGPGEIVPLHTHRWPSVIHMQTGSHFVRRDGEGHVTLDTREAGPAPKLPLTVWSGPLPPHSVENVGEDEIRLLSVELKDAAE
ncbi:MAG TPA: hypothetical protein VLW54_08995 [Candidatus Acidoferrales bacterium]|nr:hypothetical protein [Candidatus Acidoferrales bacterium]